MEDVLFQTDLPLPLHSRGKVRDIYVLDDDDHLLIVATDRISAYDVIMPNGIPGKGRVLTEMTAFWLNGPLKYYPSHFTSVINEVNDGGLGTWLHVGYTRQLQDRAMVVWKAEPFMVECVVRGYITGSGWKDYQKNGSVCGIELPPELVESQKLPEPIFTPATKAESGHDENISFEQMADIIGNQDEARYLRSVSLYLYRVAHAHALRKGIIIADTKFEFGKDPEGHIILIDEVLTPDSSRFWPADKYEPGRSQESFDKQYLRDWLDKVHWDHMPPAPALPDGVVAKTAEKYQEALRRLCS